MPPVAVRRAVRAPRGAVLSCKGWEQEAALRMLMNNLDPEVAERPDDLVVYGGRGRAARSWEAFGAIVAALRALADDETLLVQSGKPVAVFRTHEDAPRVLIANSLLVPHWATAADFARTDELARELFPENASLQRWLTLAREKVAFQGLPARICWLGYGERARMGLAINELVRTGELKAPVVIGRDHLDACPVPPPNRE